MKTVRLWFFLTVLAWSNSLFAQEEANSGMIFPKFEKGTVVFKNGVRSAALLNYNMMQEEMLFLDADSSILALANPSEVVVVIIGERRFVPTSSNSVFYEELQTGKGSFFVQRKARKLSEGKASAYGGYSQTSSIDSYSSYQSSSSGQVVKLTPNEKFRTKNECFFYLKPGNSYKKFFSAKTLGKLFKGHEMEIEKFAKEQSVDFSKIEDVTRIVGFAFGLS